MFERDGGRCVGPPRLGMPRCSKPATCWSHLLSRRYIPTRHLPENAMAFCFGCELKWHDSPLESGTGLTPLTRSDGKF